MFFRRSFIRRSLGNMTNDFLVETEVLCFSYNGSPLLRDLALKLRSGSLAALIGGNGSGKSTLMKLLCGLLRPQSGIIRINGENLQSFSRKQLARNIGYVAQS